MIRLTPMAWNCLGAVYPDEPCPEMGATQASAERHTATTGHATVTSQRSITHKKAIDDREAHKKEGKRK